MNKFLIIISKMIVYYIIMQKSPNSMNFFIQRRSTYLLENLAEILKKCLRSKYYINSCIINL